MTLQSRLAEKLAENGRLRERQYRQADKEYLAGRADQIERELKVAQERLIQAERRLASIEAELTLRDILDA